MPHASANRIASRTMRAPWPRPDEAGEPIRLHLYPGPTTVDAVRRIEVCFRNLRNRVPHASTMADEEIQVHEGCLTHPAANHGVRIRRRDLSFPYLRPVNLV